MYITSNETEQILLNSGRTFNARFDTKDLSISNIKSILSSRASVGNDKISIGNTFSSNATVITEALGMDVEGEQGQLYLTINSEDIPLSNMVITSAVTKDGLTTLTMSDKLSIDGERLYVSDLVYPANDLDVINEIANQLGVTYEYDQHDSLIISEKPKGLTLREALGYIAGKHGKNALLNRVGNIELVWFKYHGYDINPDHINAPELSEKEYTIRKLSVSKSEGEKYSKGEYQIEISVTNPLIEVVDMDVAFNTVKDMTYRTGNIDMPLGDPRIDPWDIVKYNGINIPCMQIELNYDGGLKLNIKSVGNSEIQNDIDYKGPVTKNMERYYAELVTINKALINKLDVNLLSAEVAKINTLTTNDAIIKNIQAAALNANVIQAAVAEIGYLKADSTEIVNLNAGVSHINELMFGSATGSTLQTTFANSIVSLIGDAQIKNAMIDSISASKIVAGTLYTKFVKILGDNAGHLSIDGDTIQIKDQNNVARVQIGKDGNNDYNIYVWDAIGNMMFNATGVTENGLNNGIIKDIAIADNANISGQKLDIDSVITTINSNTSSTLNASKIYIDSEKQMLDVGFKTLATTLGFISSYNLLNCNEIEEKEVNGVYVMPVFNNGYLMRINISGTSTSNFDLKIGKTTLQANITYILNGVGYGVVKLENTETHIIYVVNTQYGSNERSVLVNEDGEYIVSLAIQKGSKNSNLFPMIRKNEFVDSTYIPYSSETKVKEAIDSQGTSISVIQGQISSKIWQEDITISENRMSTLYSELQQNLEGFKTTVGNTYATIGSVSDLTSQVSIAVQTADKFNWLVSNGSTSSSITLTESSIEALTKQLKINGTMIIGEYNNLITVSELIPESVLNVKNNPGANRGAAIQNGYIVKELASRNSLTLAPLVPMSLNPNEKIYFSMKIKADGNSNIRLMFYFTDENNTYITSANSEQLAITTTEKKITGYITLPDTVATYKKYAIILRDYTLAGQIYCKEAKMYRTTNSVLIEDGSITAEKIATNSLTANLIYGGLLSSTNYLKDVRGSRLNLNDGSFDSKYLSWTSSGKITATAGQIGDWSITSDGALMSENSTGTVPGMLNRLYIQPFHKNYYDETWVISSQHSDIDSSGVLGPFYAYFYIKGNGDIYTEGDIRTGEESILRLNGTKYPQLQGNGTFLTFSHGNYEDSDLVLQDRCIRPGTKYNISLGYYSGSLNTSHVWKDIYCLNTPTVVSDRNEKNTIIDLNSELMKNFLLDCKPVSYKLNHGSSDRAHFGMIAQDVEVAMHKAGLTDKDFAGLIKAVGDDGNIAYGLRYEEFIAPIIKVIQMHEKEIDQLKQQLVVANAIITKLQIEQLG